MKTTTIASLFSLLTLTSFYGCGGGSSSTPEDEDASTSSSSGDVSSSSSSTGGEEPGSSSSSSSGSSSSSSSSSGSTVVDAGPDADVVQPPVDSCVVITPTQWVVSEVCDGPCATTFESEFTPVFQNTFIDFVRVVFDGASTQVDTDYSFSLDPTVWQRDLSGLVGNSAADARYFKAESGTLRVSSFDGAGSATFSLTDVKLVEVVYTDGVAVPVEGGTCLSLNSNVVVQ